MSGVEIMVIVVGAAAGYWLVSFLFKAKQSAGTAKPQQPDTQRARHDDTHTESSPRASRSAADDPKEPPEWHEVLGVTQHASVDEIRTAYKRLISQYHPDKVASLGLELRELATRKSQAITQAYRSAMLRKGEPV
jgi:DnaJ-domain-containing protein 1